MLLLAVWWVPGCNDSATLPHRCLPSQVRNQRNKFVALIAAAGEAAVEMADRLKLLASEQDILTGEVAAKAKLLTKVCVEVSVHADRSK